MSLAILHSITLDTIVTTLCDAITVEARGKRALARINGSPVFTTMDQLHDHADRAVLKIEASQYHGRAIEGFTIGEAIALYYLAYEERADADYMADRITYRQAKYRATRLRNQIVKQIVK